MWPWTAATAAVLLAASAVGAWRYPALPDRVPTHWSWNGEPDSFAERTVGSVFLPVVVALALAVALHLMGIVGRAAQRSSGDSWAARQGAELRVVLAQVALAVTVLICGLAVGFWLSPGMTAPGWLLWVLLGGFLLATAAVLIGARRRLRAAGSPPAMTPEEERSWTGSLYRDPDDERLWVPRRSGLGLTLNLGRPAAWVVLAGFAAIPVAVVVSLLVRG